jgi:transposase
MPAGESHHCRVTDAVYRQLVTDTQTAMMAATVELVDTGLGGHCGATQESSAVDLPAHIDTSDKPHPGPANTTLQPPAPRRKRSQTHP